MSIKEMIYSIPWCINLNMMRKAFLRLCFREVLYRVFVRNKSYSSEAEIILACLLPFLYDCYHTYFHFCLFYLFSKQLQYATITKQGTPRDGSYSGTLLVAIILFVAVAVAIDSKGNTGAGMSIYNIIIFLFIGIGTAGLILALWKECAGGIISLLSFFFFNILAAANPTPGATYFGFLLLSLVPSILYITYCR